jgi:hypothetical protein
MPDAQQVLNVEQDRAGHGITVSLEKG